MMLTTPCVETPQQTKFRFLLQPAHLRNGLRSSAYYTKDETADNDTCEKQAIDTIQNPTVSGK